MVSLAPTLADAGGKVVSIHAAQQPSAGNANPLFTSPAAALPSTATPPASDAKTEQNVKRVKEEGILPRTLKTIVSWLDYISDNSVKLMGHPLYWLGSGLLVFGVAATLFVLASTLSVEAVLVGPPLAALMLGGLLRELGKSMREGTDLSTALGNILYVPLRYFLRLTV